MSYILLPKLNSTDAAPAPAGSEQEWYEFPGGREYLQAFANSLVVPTSNVPPERIKSTPNPWARALLFEQALFTPSHPAHQLVRAEWRGLLAAIGLAPYLGGRLELTQVRIDRNPSLASLRAMLPHDPDRHWDQLALIRLVGEGRKAVVGATSPRTIVFTGIRANAHGVVPFEQNGRLLDPTVYYGQFEDVATLQVLEHWIGEVINRLQSSSDTLKPLLGQKSEQAGEGADTRLGHLLRLFRDWRSETITALNRIGGAPVGTAAGYDDSALSAEFADAHVLRSLYDALPSVRRVERQEASVLHVKGTSVVADPGKGVVHKNRKPYNGKLKLPAGQSREVVEGRVGHGVAADPISGIPTVDFAKYFERHLIQIVETSEQHATTLRVAGPTGVDAYLLPFEKNILDYVSPEQLQAWTSIATDGNSGYVVTVEVPIGEQLSVLYSNTYRADSIIDNANPPALAVWPDFEAEGWTEYFFASLQLAKRGARLQFEPVVGEHGMRKDAPEQGLRWGKTSEPVRAWVASDTTTDSVRGLLLTLPATRQPSLVGDAPLWDISVDFGSTQSRVFRRERSDDEQPKEVTLQPRVRMLVGGAEHLPFYFFSGDESEPGSGNVEAGIPSLLWLPLGSASLNHDGWLPSDGHIFWGQKLDAGRHGRIFGNLKWRHDEAGENAAFHNFVSQLFLSVAAEAAAAGARIGSLVTAYPSVLPPWLRAQHQHEWQKVAERFKVEWREPLSESDAVVEYLVRRKQALKRSNILAVDVGGSTADFAIWRKDQVYVDSVQLAGSLFNRLVARNPAAREAVTAAARSVLPVDNILWADDDARNQILAGLLLRKMAGAKSGALRTFAGSLYSKGPGSPGELVLAHIGYLYATISFTLGMMTARQIDESEDLFNIYFAGRGAHLLTWLDAFGPGSAEDLVRHFFSAGISMDGRNTANVEVGVNLPESDAKVEVAHGLLLAKRSGSATGARVRTTFVGETCYGSGEMKWNQPLNVETFRSLEEPSRPVELADMKALQAFVHAFSTDEVAKIVADALSLSSSKMDRQLRGLIHERIFGGGWIKARDKQGAAHLVLEPFFVIEAKALLDHVTGTQLFDT